MRRLLWLLIPLAALIGACSAPRLAYERAGWLAELRLGQYVDLDAAQEKLFEAEFDALWQWHRREELPRYRNDLRAMAATVGEPQSAAQLAEWATRAETHLQRSLQRALPMSCALVTSFDVAQQASILARLDERLRKDRERYLEPSPTEQQAEARKRMRRNLERWVGALDAEQARRLEAFADTRPARWSAWIAQRERWRARLAEAFAQPRDALFCAALQPLFLNPGRDAGALRTAEANTREWFEFLAAFSHTLSPAQREHLRAKLIALAEDVEQLQAS